MQTRSRAEIVSRLVTPGIIAIFRTDRMEPILPACEALIAGGIVALEITLTVPHALAVIREARERFDSQAVIGAGTVLNAETCRAAIKAGAEFVVSPIVRAQVVAAAHDLDRPVMLGAYTPTEAQLAHEAGADFVKIFPADRLGPAYIQTIRGPLPHLRIVPTGGVDLHTAADFLAAGCAALGVGSSLLTREILQAENWAELSRLARAFVAIAQAAGKK